MNEKKRNWEKLKAEQIKLAEKIILRDNFDKIRLIAGVTQAYFDNKIVTAFILMNKSMKIIDKTTHVMKEELPYKTGFKSYRELPVIISAFNKLKKKPDLIMVEGHGISHPRRIGMASHLGLILNIPTIGVAQKLITGKNENGKVFIEKELRCLALQTKEKSNPIFVSPGHLISIGTAHKIVKESIKTPHKMPEPLHIAKKIAKAQKKNSLLV